MLRTTILIQLFIDGSFNYPSTPKSTRFLYYLSVYGNLSKNSFFSAHRPVLSESGCKGTAFYNTSQIFRQLFFKNGKDFRDYLHFRASYYQNAELVEHPNRHSDNKKGKDIGGRSDDSSHNEDGHNGVATIGGHHL